VPLKRFSSCQNLGGTKVLRVEIRVLVRLLGAVTEQELLQEPRLGFTLSS
jgi:hypothetical protein